VKKILGALEGYTKGDKSHPLFARMQNHINEHNAACDRRTASCPWWRKVLYLLGFHRQFYRWHHHRHLRYKP
jgi:hypothetical protein